MGKAQAASLIFTLFFFSFLLFSRGHVLQTALRRHSGINGKSEFPLHKYVGKPSDSETP